MNRQAEWKESLCTPLNYSDNHVLFYRQLSAGRAHCSLFVGDKDNYFLLSLKMLSISLFLYFQSLSHLQLFHLFIRRKSQYFRITMLLLNWKRAYRVQIPRKRTNQMIAILKPIWMAYNHTINLLIILNTSTRAWHGWATSWTSEKERTYTLS